MKILLDIHTEIREDTSKDRLEDAYLISPKDNHIKIPPRIQTTLIIFLNKAVIFPSVPTTECSLFLIFRYDMII